MEKYILKEDLRILCVTAGSFPEGIQKAFNTLENLIGGKENRTFFGISKPENGIIIYKAGALEAYPNEGTQHGFETIILQKGTYLTELVHNFKQNTSYIEIAFQQLLNSPDLDPASFCVEWYKDNDILCMIKLNEL
ncbi:transcriptional regulator [Mucilaginibacter terrae]|uniref:transcriptional regulator n=1 Tax=Mucilaginibacter terrae TaxID=1955052 RepID=UPI00362D50CF